MLLAWNNEVIGVKLHIYAGTDIDQSDEFGNIPLLLAVEKGHIGVLELLIKHEANLEISDPDGFTPLIMSAELNHPELLQIPVSMPGRTSKLRTRPSAPRWTGPSSCSRPTWKLFSG